MMRKGEDIEWVQYNINYSTKVLGVRVSFLLCFVLISKERIFLICLVNSGYSGNFERNS